MAVSKSKASMSWNNNMFFFVVVIVFLAINMKSVISEENKNVRHF